jgi:hypothetical protein
MHIIFGQIITNMVFHWLLERVYEDHELLVENLMMWTRDSKNKLLFLERPDKTELFSAPENFLLSPTDRSNTDFDDHARAILLEVLKFIRMLTKIHHCTQLRAS